jgi:hypothetical protein
MKLLASGAAAIQPHAASTNSNKNKLKYIDGDGSGVFHRGCGFSYIGIVPASGKMGQWCIQSQGGTSAGRRCGMERQKRNS